MATAHPQYAPPRQPTPEELNRLPPDGGPQWNRLVFELSPYLLQHAANPVNWYPWGKAAFDKAKNENKPVFLSVGYATCHWCHVMAHESFEDPDVAFLLNRHFIAIKVDREERPDIDQVYMTLCQTMTGQGGWPLNCFLTANKEAFFAGSYFPKHTQQGRAGLMELLAQITQLWQYKRTKIFNSATELTQSLVQFINLSTSDNSLPADLAVNAYTALRNSFDAQYGGFGQSPKFPSPHQLLFLLRHWLRSDDPQALHMVEKTLHAIRLGRLFDHIGLGFHRYSTDRLWLLPHFEKMLYDQAMLLIAYSETFAATGNDFYKKTAAEIIQYVLTKMQHPQGGFYSAEDADSEGQEAKFYTWSYDELMSLLPIKDRAWFATTFNIRPQGNLKEETTGQLTGANIPFLSDPLPRLASQAGSDPEHWQQRWGDLRQQLNDHREQRVHPLKDDKVLTDWNGLMIAALARASVLLGNETYLLEAQRAFQFVLQYLTECDGQLKKRFRNGTAGLSAHLDDYAFMIWAALELHQASLEVKPLEQAILWLDMALEHFWDEVQGGFYLTRDESELPIRLKQSYDAATPSGNSVMAYNLAHLFHLTGQIKWQTYFYKLLHAFSADLISTPAAYTMLHVGHDLMQGPTQNLLFVGDEASTSVITPLTKTFLPNTLWLAISNNNRQAMGPLAPFTEQYRVGDELALYPCQDHLCEQAVHGAQAIGESLTGLTKTAHHRGHRKGEG